ncbi:nucleoside phosphorylase domain-containing protein [Aspergillus pseudoustus]|uniref:Nucleoside phosphorylase domain-containing protein n=1 Tax=Aspergillus pseudoustus TaxID=1810923 RepID=A0ABR4I9L3_9EURO
MATETTPTPPPPTDFMIGWICVLQAEYRAAISILDERYDTTSLVRGQGDKNHYVLGRVGDHKVAINLPPAATYGQLHAARIALDMRSTFPRVRFVLLVGIAGGAPSAKHDIRLGDVVLGTSVVPYATGKETDKGFERHAMVRAHPTELLDAITFLDERIWSEDVVLAESVEQRVHASPGERGQVDFRRPSNDRFYQPGYMHQETGCHCLEANSDSDSDSQQQQQQQQQHKEHLYPRGDRRAAGRTSVVQFFQGAIGSDNIVMKNARSRDEIARRENILCFEMEATEVMDVVPCLPIRGMSDYADGHKNDGWHLYASLAAATSLRDAARDEVQTLKRFQEHVKLHLQDLDRILNQHGGDDFLLSSADPSDRERYTRLKMQVQKDEGAMDSLAEFVDTTSTLLTTLGRIRNDANLSTAGSVLAAGSGYLSLVMNLLFPTVSISRGFYRGLRALGTGPSRPSDPAEMQAMLTYV